MKKSSIYQSRQIFSKKSKMSYRTVCDATDDMVVVYPFYHCKYAFINTVGYPGTRPKNKSGTRVANYPKSPRPNYYEYDQWQIKESAATVQVP